MGKHRVLVGERGGVSHHRSGGEHVGLFPRGARIHGPSIQTVRMDGDRLVGCGGGDFTDGSCCDQCSDAGKAPAADIDPDQCDHPRPVLRGV
jgi:hypothetical protein